MKDRRATVEQAVAYCPPALPVRECRLLDALAGKGTVIS